MKDYSVVKSKHLRYTKKKYGAKRARKYAMLTRDYAKEEVPVQTGETRDSIKVHNTGETWGVISDNPIRSRNGTKYPAGGRYEFKDSPVEENRDKYQWLARGREQAQQDMAREPYKAEVEYD